MIAALDILKVPLVNSAVIAATTFIEGITDVLQVLILLATLVWTIVKIANALKEFHGED
jgi:Na+-transporting methylmalonyl-CoA/oxaloacetate decarboxylase gamma subunit